MIIYAYDNGIILIIIPMIFWNVGEDNFLENFLECLD